ncbi:hypothetical protein T492DRAFT_912778 [Pavlovales sp. CCMP2436]|nr:hypothetical protein T492DRAFT_912778 [Pavlovales sp. CCMP2436]
MLKASRSERHTQVLAGALSNLEFLLELNSLAGRTACDLSQYPVLPCLDLD